MEMQSLQCKDELANSNEDVGGDHWYSIDTDMVSSKLSYFFQNAKDSCYLPYMNLFLSETGLSTQQAGMVNGLRFVGFIIGAPLWAILADYKRNHTLVVFILCFGSFLLMTSLPFVSIPLNDNPRCSIGHDIPRNTTRNSSTTTPGRIGFPIIDSESRHQNETTAVQHSNNEKLFATMMVMTLVTSCFDGSTQGFVDAGVVQKISSRVREATFGAQRLWGAVGFGSGAFVSSLATEWLSGLDLPCYTPPFLVYGVLMLGLLISTQRLFTTLSFSPPSSNPKPRSPSMNSDMHSDSVSVGKALKQTVCKVSVIFFFSTVFVVGTIHAVYLGFLFILLRGMNCPNIVMGLSIAVGAVAAAIGIKVSENFIRGFGGTVRVLCLCCLSWGIRLLLFSYLENPWYVLPIQLLQGFGYGMFLATGVVHIKMLCGPDIYTSMYGIFNGLFYGAGAVVGNMIGGVVLMNYGIRTLFFGTSIAGFAWTVAMIVFLVVENCEKDT